MKKLLLLVAVVAISFTVNAQETSFGVKAGLNLASLSGDNISDDIEKRTGFHFGLTYEYEFSDVISLQSELMYSTQGAKMKGVDSTLELDYLNAPILLKFYVVEGLSLEAGPQLGFNISAQEVTNGESEDVEDLNTFDLGGAFGLGFKFDNGLSIGARYVVGFSNIISEEDEFNPAGDDENAIKNNVIQFSLGFNF